MTELFEYVINFMMRNEIENIDQIWSMDSVRELQEEFMMGCYKIVQNELEAIRYSVEQELLEGTK